MPCAPPVERKAFSFVPTERLSFAVEFLRRHWALLLLVLLPLIVVGRPLLSGECIGPFDQIRQMAPWNGPAPAQAWDVLQADGVLQFYAWRDLVLTAWGQGQVPAWNPYVLGGTPLLANSQSGGFYPPHLVLGLLHVPTSPAIVLLAWFHLAMLALGTRALVRVLGGTEAGGVVAGIAFGFSPFMLGWLALPSVISTVCWIPWILASLGSPKALRRLPLFVALLLLGGHLQFAAYGLMATALFLAFQVRTLGLKSSLLAVLLLGIGAGLAAPQVVPVLAYSKFSHRRNAPSEEGYAAYTASAIRPTDVISRLAHPFSQGDPTERVNPQVSLSTYWPTISRNANYAETALTVGPVVLLLLGLGAAGSLKGRAWVPLATLSGLALLLAVGSPLNRLLYFFAPGWSATGSPGRVIVLFVMGLCVLAGLAVPERIDLTKRRLAFGVGGFALLGLLGLAIGADTAPSGVSPDVWSALSGAATTGAPAFLVSVLLAAAAVVWSALGRPKATAGLVAAAVVVPVLGGVTHLVRTSDASFLHKAPFEVGPTERIAIVNGPWSLTEAAPALYPPNAAAVARIHQIGGYDSLIHRDTVELLRGIDGEDPAPPVNGNMMFVKRPADPKALAEAGVTQVWSRVELPQFSDLIGFENGVYRYRVAGPGRATVAGNPADLREDGLNRVTVHVTSPGPLTLRDRHMNGWTGAIDAKSYPLKDGPWLGLDADQVTDVSFTYRAPGVTEGTVLAALAALVWLAILFVGRTQRAAKPIPE